MMLDRVKAFDPKKQAVSVLKDTESEVIEYMKDQLYAGLDGNGGYLAPSYLHDPYFRTREEATAYAKYKSTLNQRTPASYLSPKPYDVPNLIITGRLVYNRLRLTVNGDTFSVGPAAGTRKKLEAKYYAPFKLSPLVMREYKRRVYFKQFVLKFKQALS